jgi:GT2 family glycosyltransferase
MKIAALMTVHNRRDTTLSCLRSLASNDVTGVSIDIFLVDDGSTDGTGDAVRAEFPHVHLISGSGHLFWCRGMELAWRSAISHDRYDSFLWLNDDVQLVSDALAGFSSVIRQLQADGRWPAVLVGSLADPVTGATTYGGHRLSSSWHPGKMRMIEPRSRPTPVDTFNGNVVLVPSEIVERIGIIDAAFSHATGDNDYGLRASRAGIEVIVVPGHVGACARNPRVKHTLRTMWGRKGLPWRDWLLFTRRHTRYRLWPVAYVGPYIRLMAVSCRNRTK